MAPDVDRAAERSSVERRSVERIIDQFLPVPPASVETEFERIWQESARGGVDGSSVRLRISNIVVWGTEAEAAGRFDALTESLAPRHPCRGILCVTSPDATAVESAISAHCWRTPGGGRHLCSEEILLRARAGDERALSSALSALLVPELPAYLWLVGEPDARQRIPEEVVDGADLLIVDTHDAAVPMPGLRTLGAAIRNSDARVTDMAWLRGSAWRGLVAQFFDHPDAAQLLEKVDVIEIAGGSGQISSAAWLAAGWLAARLDLSPASVNATNTLTEATLYDGTRGVRLAVAPAPRGEELARISITAGGAHFDVELHEESDHIHVRSDLPSALVHQIVAPEAADDATLILAAIEDTTDPAILREAVGAALALIEG
jgi:glucose-6-phosphate dehydrogenase assembly protein OpcA